MVHYHTFGPDAEVLGQAMLAFIKSTHFETIQPILQDHGLEAIQPDAWYPQQTWLDVFSDLANEGNAMFDFVSVGMHVVHSAKLPPQIETLSCADALLNWGRVFNLNNRGVNAGSLKCELVGMNHVKVVACVPYPDDFLYGTFYGIAQRFVPKGMDFMVYFDEKVPCRELGGEATVIHVSWGN